MIKVDVKLDNGLLQTLQAHLSHFGGAGGGKIMPATKSAFDMAAKLIQKSWQGWARGGSLAGIPEIRRPNARLASSIKVNRMSDFDAVIETDSPYMERIQRGTPELDMKETHPYGRKSRVSAKDRVPYLIIPFRWGTPGKVGGARAHFGNTITPEVMAILRSKDFDKSVRTGETHLEKNARGEDVRRSEYTWGDRLKDDGNMNDMVRMTSEAGRGSTYFTFRVISAKSPPKSWIRRKVPPVDVVGAVKRATEPLVADIMQAGIEHDIGI